jgi:hypothetical protein
MKRGFKKGVENIKENIIFSRALLKYPIDF